MSAAATREPAWLILPTYNEAENIAAFVGAVQAAIPASSHILIVDDNSPDGTGKIADRLAADASNVSVLHRPHKEGLGPACIAGFRHALAAGAALVLEMDSDFSHDPAHLPAILAAVEDADLVIGSRYVPGGRVADWGVVRRAISRGGSTYARLVLGLEVRDLTAGFKCFRREVLDRSTSTRSSRGVTPSKSRSPTALSSKGSRWPRCRSSFATAVRAAPRSISRSSRRRSGGCRCCACGVSLSAARGFSSAQPGGGSRRG